MCSNNILMTHQEYLLIITSASILPNGLISFNVYLRIYMYVYFHTCAYTHFND